jgi:hypothetical protein
MTLTERRQERAALALKRMAGALSALRFGMGPWRANSAAANLAEALTNLVSSREAQPPNGYGYSVGRGKGKWSREAILANRARIAEKKRIMAGGVPLPT